MSKKIFWIIGIIAVCIIGIIVLTDAKQETVAIDYAGQPFVGEESAPVEIIEFGDYKCPHCGDFNNTLFPIINEQFVETGKAKFYFMNYSFIAPTQQPLRNSRKQCIKNLAMKSFGNFITCYSPIKQMNLDKKM